jgi:hypothetical protein
VPRLTLISAALAAVVATPVIAHATDTGTTTDPAALAWSQQTFANAGGEPNVTVSPDGQTVLADGLGSSSDPSALYRSTDGGQTFTRVHQNTPQVGASDWDMHFVSNTTVVAVDLSLGTGIYVDVSKDAGLTWTQSNINMDVYDRPWVGAHGNDLYVVAKGFDAVPYLFTSHDLGATFDPLPIPLYGTSPVPVEAGGTAPTPTDAFVTNQNAYVDNLTVDPNTGDVFVLYGIDAPETYPSSPPLGAPDRLYVAHLENGAMVSHPVIPGVGATGDAFYAGFNWMTEDQAGTLYVVGNGKHAGADGVVHQAPWLSFSKDKGVTWSPLVDIGTPGKNSVYGAIAGGAAGNLGLVYYEGDGAPGTDSNDKQNWFATMAWITGADTSAPTITKQKVVTQAVHNADICLDGIVCGLPGFGSNRNLLDYIDNTIAPDGTQWGVFSSDGPATGVADSDGSRAPVSVILVHQTAGENLGAGVTGT